GSKGYLGTGYDASGDRKDFWEFDPTGVGIEEMNNSNDISIFPNPSNGIFNLNTKITKGEISIRNILGENIFQSQIINLNSEIDLSDQPNGIYFITVKSETKSFTQKVIIQ
ncbi:MAG TPA: T9SS type A sorting domain-containing protein, partial [Bacteroidia bacterium]|nr:T9SS type A sorting domain-containing protein [Bacteroidia bacterium]